MRRIVLLYLSAVFAGFLGAALHEMLRPKFPPADFTLEDLMNGARTSEYAALVREQIRIGKVIHDTKAVVDRLQGRCEPGYNDCDGLAANGCETSVMDSRQNCGQCGHSCGKYAICSNGVCENIMDGMEVTITYESGREVRCRGGKCTL